MSQVFKRGTLTPVFVATHETLEDACKRVIAANRNRNRVSNKSKPVKLPHGYDNYIQLLEEELFEDYIIIDDIIYSIVEEEIQEMYEARKDGGGQIEYTVKYNDSGMAHPEAIKEAFDSIVNW